jgi:hypothetical protein
MPLQGDVYFQQQVSYPVAPKAPVADDVSIPSSAFNTPRSPGLVANFQGALLSGGQARDLGPSESLPRAPLQPMLNIDNVEARIPRWDERVVELGTPLPPQIYEVPSQRGPGRATNNATPCSPLEYLESESQNPDPEDVSSQSSFREHHLEKVPFKEGLRGNRSDWEDPPGVVPGPDARSGSAGSGESRQTWRTKVSSKLSSMSSHARQKAIQLGHVIKDDGPVDVNAKVTRKWLFRTAGRDRELQLSHAQGKWYFIVDSELVTTKTHNNSTLKRFRTSLDLPIPLSDEEQRILGPVTAVVNMEWNPRSVRWYYTLTLGGEVVPPVWSKSAGPQQGHRAEVGPGVMPAVPEDAVADMDNMRPEDIHACFDDDDGEIDPGDYGYAGLGITMDVPSEGIAEGCDNQEFEREETNVDMDFDDTASIHSRTGIGFSDNVSQGGTARSAHEVWV